MARFKKGHKQPNQAKGRPPGSENKLSAEAKDVLVRAYTEIGGFEKFCEWVTSTPERLDTFYSKMWIRLLPMNIKDVVYKSYHELSIALADRGISLESIQKLKEIDLKAERPKDE
jgi:hypothetical protein